MSRGDNCIRWPLDQWWCVTVLFLSLSGGLCWETKAVFSLDLLRCPWMACPWDSLSSHESRNKESDRLQSRHMPSKSCSQRRLSAVIVSRSSTRQSREGLRERHHSQRREEPEKGFSTACCIYSYQFRSLREVTRLWCLINTLETGLLLYRESYVGFCLSDPMLKCWQFQAKGLWERIRNLDFLNSGAALNPVHVEQYILWVTIIMD